MLSESAGRMGMFKKKLIPAFMIFLIIQCLFILTAIAGSPPEGFVYAEEIIPHVILELRYRTDDNFVGRPIDGYEANRCIISREAAQALSGVQRNLKRFDMGLKIFDAYRPQRAVNHFVRWAKDINDTKMKKKYYPDVDKKDLFKKRYIAEKSSHSRGSAVDVTIVAMDLNGNFKELDMGSGFDFFSPKSWPSNTSVGLAQRAHRMLLQYLMVANGFVPYREEWWHFTLKNEPFPETYFDFPIE